MFKRIIDTDLMILQRTEEDGQPYYSYTGAELKDTIKDEYYNLNIGLLTDVIQNGDRISILEDSTASLELKVDEYIISNNLVIDGILELDQQQSSAIRSLQDDLKQFKNQSRAYATYAVRMKDPLDYANTSVGDGDVTFDNDKWSAITKVKIFKEDIEGKYFDYTALATGETLELVVYKEAGDPDRQNQLVTARASYTVTGVSSSSADPNVPVELSLRIINSSSQNDVTLGTELGGNNEPDIVQFYVFPSFDPALYVTTDVFNDRVSDIEQDVSKNTSDIVENSLPAGAIVPFMGSAAPVGWFKCNGTTFSKDTNPNLYKVLGNKTSTPDLRGKWLTMGGADGIPSDTGKSVDESTKTPTKNFTGITSEHSHTTQQWKRSFNKAGSTYALSSKTDDADSAGNSTTNSVAVNLEVTGGGDDHTRPNSFTINWIIRGG